MFPPRDTICFLSLFLLPVFFARSYAQSLLPESPLSSSLSNSEIALAERNSFRLNPAGSLADSLHPFRAGLSYAPFVGGLKDASQSAAEGIYYSSSIGTSFGAGVTSLSYNSLYSDLSIYASAARSFALANSRQASIGVRLRYETISTTPEYPRIHFLLLDLGFQMDLTPEFSLGGAALNLLGANYEVVNGETERLERPFLIGIAYHPLVLPVRIFTSLQEQQSQPLRIGFGVEYEPVSFLALRIGTSTDTGNITTGIGITYENFSFDAGSRFDKALGPIFSFGASGAW